MIIRLESPVQHTPRATLNKIVSDSHAYPIKKVLFRTNRDRGYARIQYQSTTQQIFFSNTVQAHLFVVVMKKNRIKIKFSGFSFIIVEVAVFLTWLNGFQKLRIT